MTSINNNIPLSEIFSNYVFQNLIEKITEYRDFSTLWSQLNRLDSMIDYQLIQASDWFLHDAIKECALEIRKAAENLKDPNDLFSSFGPLILTQRCDVIILKLDDLSMPL